MSSDLAPPKPSQLNELRLTTAEKKALVKMLRWSITAKKESYTYEPGASMEAMRSLAVKLGLNPDEINDYTPDR